MKKKLIFILMSVTLCIFTLIGCGKDSQQNDLSQNSTYNDVPIMETTLDPSDENYYQKLYEAELYNFKLIRSIPTLYEEEQWDVYFVKGTLLPSMNTTTINESKKEIINSAKVEREKLVQIKSYEDNVWFIWGADMASTVEPDSLTYTSASEDSAGFAPFLLPYLLEDQSQAKGNLIIISGGGYASRNNKLEGYPTAKAMNELGYNCFVLQRRVTPYNKEDTWLDLQRSIRYIRYNSESLGLGGSECIAAAGFSGGSSTVLGTVSNLYGAVQPTLYDSSYTPDEIDAVSADLNVAIPIYGPRYNDDFVNTYEGLVTDNPSLPAMLIIVGQNDSTGAPADCLKLYSSVTDKTDAELYIFALNIHGFGAGKEGTNSEKWPSLAASFMEEIVANQGAE